MPKELIPGKKKTPVYMKSSGFKLRSGNSPMKAGLWKSLTGKKFSETKLGQTKLAKDVAFAGRQIKSDIASTGIVKTKLVKDISQAGKQIKTDITALVGHLGKRKSETPEEKPSSTPSGNGWTTRKGDPWQYRKAKTGYQTKKGTGKVIDVKKGSTAEIAISKIFNK